MPPSGRGDLGAGLPMTSAGERVFPQDQGRIQRVPDGGGDATGTETFTHSLRNLRDSEHPVSLGFRRRRRHVTSPTPRMSTPRLVRKLALPLALAGVFGTASPALACDGATVQSIVFQAAKDGHVRDGYSVACLRQAQDAQTPDLLTYSSSDSAIRLALLRAVQVPPRPVRQLQSLDRTSSQAGTSSVAIADTGPLGRFINAGAHGPGSVPAPVIVLGAAAFLLLGGGLASIVLRRRLEPGRGAQKH